MLTVTPPIAPLCCVNRHALSCDRLLSLQSRRTGTPVAQLPLMKQRIASCDSHLLAPRGWWLSGSYEVTRATSRCVDEGMEGLADTPSYRNSIKDPRSLIPTFCHYQTISAGAGAYLCYNRKTSKLFMVTYITFSYPSLAIKIDSS